MTEDIDSMRDFIKFLSRHKIEFVDIKFTDLLGTWQHYTFSVDSLSRVSLKEGIGIDGSSIRGGQEVEDSDMLLVPDFTTVVMDPFFAKPTVSVIADIKDPETGDFYTRDPRFVAKKGEEYLKKTGIADICYIGAEPEFFIFDEARYEQNQHMAMYYLDSVEAAWNTGKINSPSLGYKENFRGGRCPVSPADTLYDLRSEMVSVMKKVGIEVETHHHEAATAGQCEISMKYQPLLRMSDQFMWYKYIVKNVAKRAGKTVTFMPKPILDDNGSGMHTHISLWQKGKNLFAGREYAGLSKLALYAIGGILKHTPAILAFAAPTTNSYRRLVPGYDAPVNIAMSARNRSTAIRIPVYSRRSEARRIEFRCPDPLCNSYLTWTAILMAMLDGIRNRIKPTKPLEEDAYELSEEELSAYPKIPSSLDEALDSLLKDCEFLLKGNVFTEDLINTWIEWKRENEIRQLMLRPHPYEFYLYYDS